MRLAKIGRFGRWAAGAAALLALTLAVAAINQAAWSAEGDSAPKAGAAKAAEKAKAPRVIPDDLELIRDVEYGKGGDVSLKLDILRPKKAPAEPMPVVVYIHGGGWKGGSKNNMPGPCTVLAQRGYFCASVEYRLSQVAPFPAQIEDCKCAIRFLRAHAKQYNIDPNRIGVWGHSAGGHLVALLGTSGDAKDLEGKGGWQDESSRVQCVIDCFGPADFTILAKDQNAPQGGMGSPVAQLLGGPLAEKADLAAKASPITYVSKDDPPILIMHGDQDPTVPVNQSERFYEVLKKAGVDATLHVVKGAGHGFGGPEIEAVTAAFFDKHLKGAGAKKE
jgi:acetyl esterase/lipase